MSVNDLDILGPLSTLASDNPSNASEASYLPMRGAVRYIIQPVVAALVYVHGHVLAYCPPNVYDLCINLALTLSITLITISLIIFGLNNAMGLYILLGGLIVLIILFELLSMVLNWYQHNSQLVEHQRLVFYNMHQDRKPKPVAIAPMEPMGTIGGTAPLRYGVEDKTLIKTNPVIKGRLQGIVNNSLMQPKLHQLQQTVSLRGNALRTEGI